MALGQAERAVDELSEVADEVDEEGFRDKFVSCLAMVRRVGSIIDEESKGSRTQEFGPWWGTTGKDPLFKFIVDVRNAEFKRGESRKQARHDLTANDFISIGEAAHLIKKDDEGRIVEEVFQEYAEPERPVEIEATHVVTWLFQGGDRDGQEVLPCMRQFLAWLQAEVLPEAERLTT